VRGLRVLLLGRPLLEIDGQPLTRLMATKHQALVFYLAGQRGPVTRSQLATLLWGELDDAAARANLRVALTRLRRWLPDVLDIDATRVGFASHESVWVDLHELESAAREPASLPVDRLAQVADLYRGPLLDGFDEGADGFEIWSRQAREGALRAAVAARRHLTHHFEQAGALGDAIEHARAWIAIDEADEHGHCNLMRLLAASGQRIAAIAQYESCRAILTERLGARPSAETYALYCRIHADAPAAGRPAEPVAQPPLRTLHGLPPRDAIELIGRETEVATLSEQLRDPACRWVTLIGPGGVGKTRLALAVAEAVQNEFVGGVVFVSGRDLGNADADAAAAAIAQRFGVPQARTSIVWRAVEQRLAGRPTLLVLDNLETLEDARPLLQGLVDALPSVRVLATSRSRVGGAREWLFEMAGLSLQRAADDAAASSAAARLFVRHARRLDTGFDAATQAPAIDHICELVAGLPLALEMAARGVLISGCDAIAARIAAGTPLEDPDRPRDDRQRSIETVLRDSWSQLPRPAQQAACRLARLPQEFDAGMAAEVAQVDAASLDELRGHSWLSKASGDRLSMHPLQRDFVRRQPDAGAVAEELDESLARYVCAAMVAVPPFADVTADAMRRAGAWQSASFTAAVIAQAAGHVCRHWDLAKMMPFVDTLSAHLCAAGRWPEACTLLHDAAERRGLPMWRRVGWLLREAEMLNEAGAVRRAAQAYQRGLELLGLRGFDSNLLLLRQVPRLMARLVALEGWPDSRADHQAFSRLLVRSLSFVSQLIAFTAQPLPMFSAGWLAWAIAARTLGRAERAVA